MKKSRPQSPLIRRLLYFWLPLAALLLGMGYFSQARYNPAKEAKAGLDRLNYWRTQAGLQPLAPNPQLQKAAQNHAQYLSRHPEGHDETQRSHPSYDGKENPNPMPTRNPVGNPVSIAFYGNQAPITLHRFTLRSSHGEIANPTILTAANDPNHQLQTNEFALFAPKPLDYNTEYTAQFVYSQNGKQHTETWTFRTRKKRHWFE